MKGITPVIAVILLLLITVSMVGFAYIWLTRLSTGVATQIENKTSQIFGKSIRIENAKVSGTIPTATTNIDVRNTGDTALTSAEISFYIEDNRVVAANGCPATIAVGALATCTPTAVQCNVTQRLRATVPGGQDIITCS